MSTDESYKILIYSTKFAFSHMNYMGCLADTLSEAGHDVTVLQSVLDPRIKGTGCSLAKVISVVDETLKMTNEITETTIQRRKRLWITNIRNPFGIPILGKNLAFDFDTAMKNVLKRKDVMEQLRAENFDVAIGELFDYGWFPICYESGIKNLVGAHSTILTSRTCLALGCPLLPSFVPPMHTAAGDDGSFKSRLLNLVFSYFTLEFEKILENQAQEYMNEYHPSAPKVHEMVSNLYFVFANNEPLLDFPRPVHSKVVDLGGIGFKKPKPLTKEWLDLLDKRKTTILISFGTLMYCSKMPDEYRNSIVSLAKKYPEITFIWKHDEPEDGFYKEIENLYLSNWTPQTDLLASGKIALFVTHGGAGSLMETASSAVPVVVVPMFGDQLRNALMIERFGFGKMFEKLDLAYSDKLETAVMSALTDKDLRDSAKRAQAVLASRPFSPQEKLLKYMDLAVKFGGPPTLSPNGRNFTTVQYHNLDILALFVMVFGFLLALVVSVIMRAVYLFV